MRLIYRYISYTLTILTMVSILIGCRSLERVANRRISETQNVEIHQRRGGERRILDSLPEHIVITDTAGNTIASGFVSDNSTGEQITNYNIPEVMVVAKSRHLPERDGKVTVGFMVRVPSPLIDPRWQLGLTPELIFPKRIDKLDPIYLSGADFLRQQKDGYDKYRKFLASIIPDEDYMKAFFNEEGYEKALRKINEEYFKAYQSGLLDRREFIDWKNRRNRRYILFNGIMEENKTMTNPHSWKMLLPDHWLYRDVTTKTTRKKWLSYLDGPDELIMRRITPEDSIELQRKFLDLDGIMENERKKGLITDKYKELVRFPHKQARLDTVIHKGNNFEYYYTQEIPVTANLRKILLTLEGEITGYDESRVKMPPTDTLTYYISSMTQFIDHRERYRDKIISRKQSSSLTSNIIFNKGKADFVDTLSNNRREFERLDSMLYQLTFTGELVLDSISMSAGASPEGSSALNRRLSKDRAENLKKYLSTHLKDSEGAQLLKARTLGEDWERLTTFIKYDQMLEHRNDLLKIISSLKDEDKRENKMKDFPDDYNYIVSEYYPQLRAVHFDVHLHRRDMIQDTIHTEVIDEDYMQALEDMENRRYLKALDVLDSYNDYNTAICLMSMGYNDRAIRILSKELDTSDRNYLLAILNAREKNYKVAIELLIRSCKQDSQKIYRSEMDPEVNNLIKTYNIDLESLTYVSY